MAATFYFDEAINGKVQGSEMGEPNGKFHSVSLLEGEGSMIVTVEVDGKHTSLLFTDEQAVAFTQSAQAALRRLGLNA